MAVCHDEVFRVCADLLVLPLSKRESLGAVLVRALANDDEVGHRVRSPLYETLVEVAEEGLVSGKSFVAANMRCSSQPDANSGAIGFPGGRLGEPFVFAPDVLL